MHGFRKFKIVTFLENGEIINISSSTGVYNWDVSKFTFIIIIIIITVITVITSGLNNHNISI